MNPTLARFDRAALAAGVTVDADGEGRRIESAALGRRFEIRPGGLGVLRVSAYVGGALDAEAVCSLERAEALIVRIAEAERDAYASARASRP